MQYFEYCIREPFKLGGKTCMGLQFRSCVRYPAPFPCITETVHFEGLGRGWFWQVLQYFSKNIERNCSQNVRVLFGHIPAAVQLWSNVTAFPVLCSEFTFHFFSFTDFLDTCKKPPMHTYTGLGAISHLRFFWRTPNWFSLGISGSNIAWGIHAMFAWLWWIFTRRALKMGNLLSKKVSPVFSVFLLKLYGWNNALLCTPAKEMVASHVVGQWSPSCAFARSISPFPFIIQLSHGWIPVWKP